MNPNVAKATAQIRLAYGAEQASWATLHACLLNSTGLLITPEERELCDAVKVDSYQRVRRAARAVRAAGNDKPTTVPLFPSSAFEVSYRGKVWKDPGPMTSYRVVLDPAIPTPADVLAEAVDEWASEYKAFTKKVGGVPKHSAVVDYLAAYRAWKKPVPRYQVRERGTASLPFEVWDCVLRCEFVCATFADRASAERHASSLNEVKP